MEHRNQPPPIHYALDTVFGLLLFALILKIDIFVAELGQKMGALATWFSLPQSEWEHGS